MNPVVNTASPQYGVSGYNLIYAALRELQVLRAGQRPNAETIADGLQQINRLFDAWNIERLLVPGLIRAVYDLTSGQTVYGIGAGMEGRPVRIQQACLIPSGTDSELPFEITEDRSRLSARTSERLLYCDYRFPVAEVMIAPVPASGDTLVLYQWGTLNRLDDETTVVYLAPGYEHAIVTNLAQQMAAAMALHAKSPVVYAAIADQARRAKAAVKRVNMSARLELAPTDAPMGWYGGGLR